MKTYNYIKLMRPKHWIKNFLIMVPLFFDLTFFKWSLLLPAIGGFIIFSLLSSVIYIVNDINDIEGDRLDEEKRKRPLASGAVSIKEAVALVMILVGLIIFLSIIENNSGWIFLALYFVLNVAYSVKLKHVPLLDIVILASGFFIRLLYGAAITNITISFWLCMTVLALSFYLGLGKRRNELRKNGSEAEKIRGVLKFYNAEFLDKNMYMCMGMAIMFYALWTGAEETIQKMGSDTQMWTVPLAIIMAMKYSLDIECGEYADPVEVILKDKWLLLLGVVYVLVMVGILYYR